jgi:hypothetical protein
VAPFQRVHLPAHLKPEGYKFGRPTEYRPEYCDLVRQEMAKGISVSAFAGIIGVARATVFQWIKTFPDFSDAVSRAQAAQQLAWELKLIRSKKGAETMASIFALKNIAPDQWRDVRNVQHEHTIAAQTLTDAQLYAIAAGSPDAGAVIDGDCQRVGETDATG